MKQSIVTIDFNVFLKLLSVLLKFICLSMFAQFVRLSITKVNRTRPLDKPFPGVLIELRVRVLILL